MAAGHGVVGWGIWDPPSRERVRECEIETDRYRGYCMQNSSWRKYFCPAQEMSVSDNKIVTAAAA